MLRNGILAGVVVVIFVLVVAGMLMLLPYPRRNVDYLVIGAMATMVAMGVLFIILVRTSHKGSDIFFKRRKP